MNYQAQSEPPLSMQRVGRSMLRIWVWFLVTVVGVLAVGGFATMITLSKHQALQDLTNYEQTLQQKVLQLNQLRAQKTLLEQSCKNLDTQTRKLQKRVNGCTTAAYASLKEIADLLPQQINLESFVCAKRAVTIKGRANAVSHIRSFMGQLAKSKKFCSPKLIAVNRGRQGKHEHGVIGFEIKALVR